MNEMFFMENVFTEGLFPKMECLHVHLEWFTDPKSSLWESLGFFTLRHSLLMRVCIIEAPDLRGDPQIVGFLFCCLLRSKIIFSFILTELLVVFCYLLKVNQKNKQFFLATTCESSFRTGEQYAIQRTRKKVKKPNNS